MKAGIIVIHANGMSPDTHSFEVEVHTDDETHWGGYSRINPFAGFQRFSKQSYTLIEDRRPQ